MDSIYVLHQKSSKKLVDLGLLPAHATSFALVSEVNRPVKLRTEFFVSDEQYRQILAVMSEEIDARPVNPSTAL